MKINIKNCKPIPYGLFAPEDCSIVINEISVTYTQIGDCCQDAKGEGEDHYVEDQRLKVTLQNGGIEAEDAYLVIETERWAVDNTAELLHLIEDFKCRAFTEEQRKAWDERSEKYIQKLAKDENDGDE